MTLRELYTMIEGIAREVPDVRTILENDMLKLNEEREAKYGVFGITQEPHTGSLGWITYTLNLFFVDRLVNGQDNEVEIQSPAIEVLRAIIMRVEENVPLSGQVRCAGAWAVVSIQAPVSDCNDIFNG